MGHDPFAAGPAPQAHVVRIQIVRQASAYIGTVELLDPFGHVLWSRPPLAHGDCQRLVSVFGSVSIRAAIDTAPASPAAAPTIVVLPAPPVTPQPPTPPTEPPTPRLVPGLRLGARAGVAVGVLPGPAATFSGDVGISLRNFSLNLEGTATLPTEREVDAGVRLRTSYAGGALVPCGHYGWFTGCGVFSFGAMRAEAVNVTTAAQSTGIHVGAGLRAALEWPIVPAFALRLAADALVNLHPLAPQVRIGATPADAKPVEVWRSGPFATVLGAGVVVRFGGSPPASGTKEPQKVGASRESKQAVDF